MATRTKLAIAIPALLLAIAFTACGGDEEPTPPSGPVGVEIAVELPDGASVTVSGMFFTKEGESDRLCAVLMESFPPQCGKPALELEGADVETIPGITTSQGVSWSDQPVELSGTIRDGVLVVE